MVMTLDVTNASHIAAAVQVVQEETSGSDYLINNAGRNHFMPLLDENIETAKRIFDTNVWGTLARYPVICPISYQSEWDSCQHYLDIRLPKHAVDE